MSSDSSSWYLPGWKPSSRRRRDDVQQGGVGGEGGVGVGGLDFGFTSTGCGTGTATNSSSALRPSAAAPASSVPPFPFPFSFSSSPFVTPPSSTTTTPPPPPPPLTTTTTTTALDGSNVLVKELDRLSILERNEVLTVFTQQQRQLQSEQRQQQKEEQQKVKEEIQHSLLARELTQMSLQERESILHDIHGVSNDIPVEESSPELIANALNDFITLIRQEEAETAFRKGGSSSIPALSSSLSSSALDLALSINRNYIYNNRSFLLLFLRAERFNILLALDRLKIFLQHKLDLFGLDKLCQQRISYSDLTDGEDISALETGALQVLPERDPAGRAIVVFFSPAIDHRQQCKHLLRAQFYQLMSILEDEQTQINGVVLILYRVGQVGYNAPNPWTVWNCARQFSSLIPWRVRGCHLCAVDYKWQFVWPTRWFLEKRTRVRTRIHQGSQVECLYRLMTFGIPTKDFPITVDLNLQRKQHLAWIRNRIVVEQHRQRQQLKQQRLQQQQQEHTLQEQSSSSYGQTWLSQLQQEQQLPPEQRKHLHQHDHAQMMVQQIDPSPQSASSLPTSSSAVAVTPYISMTSGAEVQLPKKAVGPLNPRQQQNRALVIVPTRHDILFGRGKPIQEHPGNIRFGISLESILHRYETMKRHEKTTLAKALVTQMKAIGGARFLKQKPGHGIWEVVDDEMAREKVSHTFRSLRSSTKQHPRSQQQQQQKAGERNIDKMNTDTTSTSAASTGSRSDDTVAIATIAASFFKNDGNRIDQMEVNGDDDDDDHDDDEQSKKAMSLSTTAETVSDLSDHNSNNNNSNSNFGRNRIHVHHPVRGEKRPRPMQE